MDSSLAPVLASIFMGFRESKLLNEYNLNKPKFYLIYVDDILATFNNKQDSLNFVNNIYPNIKCNIEKKAIPPLSLIYLFRVSIIKISHFQHIANRPIQDLS